jgi:hypothetical protein
MKAYDTYGCRCNGCGYYAEFCSCRIDKKTGELIEASKDKSTTGRPRDIETEDYWADIRR